MRSRRKEAGLRRPGDHIRIRHLPVREFVAGRTGVPSSGNAVSISNQVPLRLLPGVRGRYALRSKAGEGVLRLDLRNDRPAQLLHICASAISLTPMTLLRRWQWRGLFRTLLKHPSGSNKPVLLTLECPWQTSPTCRSMYMYAIPIRSLIGLVLLDSTLTSKETPPSRGATGKATATRRSVDPHDSTTKQIVCVSSPSPDKIGHSSPSRSSWWLGSLCSSVNSWNRISSDRTLVSSEESG